MRNIMIKLEYDGTNYHGWQSQRNAITVQDTVKKAIKEITNEEVNLIGASRTDAGVHAYCQIANFKSNTKIPIEQLSYALNSVLPNDIIVTYAKEVKESFHSRYSSKSKRYRYIIFNRRFPSPLLRNFSWYIPYRLNIEKMKMALIYFKGTHDFSAFKSSGGSTKSSIRTINDISLEQCYDKIKIEVEANGFLYNMVRIIVGTLVEVGLEKINPIDIKKIIESKDRLKAGRTAPPQGLYLIRIYY